MVHSPRIYFATLPEYDKVLALERLNLATNLLLFYADKKAILNITSVDIPGKANR
jgi:hypothetical protein